MLEREEALKDGRFRLDPDVNLGSATLRKFLTEKLEDEEDSDEEESRTVGAQLGTKETVQEEIDWNF